MNESSSDLASDRPQRLSMRWGYHFFIFYMRIMPSYEFGQALLMPLWWLANTFAGKARRVSMNNLSVAFGDTMSMADKAKTVSRSFLVLMRSMLGILFYAQHPQYINDALAFHDRDKVDRLLEQGKGLIVVTAHLGCFPLMLFRLAQEGYKVNAIVNPGRDWNVQEHLWHGAAQCGVKLIVSLPAKKCIKEAMGALKRNEILVIVPDQNYGANNRVFVDFFDRIAGTTSSPAIFAMRHQAPVLPMFAVEKDGQWQIVTDECCVNDEPNVSAQSVRAYMQKIIHAIERYVRQYPEQYMWMHNRWKTQPNEEELKELKELGVVGGSLKPPRT